MATKARTLRTQDWPLQRWQEHFRQIYGPKNKRFSDNYIWLRMLEEVTELIKPVQKTKLKEIEWQIPDVFAWICAFADKREIGSLDDLLWENYRNGCRSCKKFVCECTRQPEVDAKPLIKDKKKWKKQESLPFERPGDLNGWQQFFNKMYGHINEQFDAKDTVTNLAIDVGKVSRHLRLKENENVLPGLTSIIAWLLGLCNQFSSNIEEGAFRLGDLLATKYGNGCPACNRQECRCAGVVSSIFISFPGELAEDAKLIKAYLDSKGYKAHLFPFPERGPHFAQGRMQAAFEQITNSDAAVVLLKSQFRPAVYAEFQQIWYWIPKERIFVLVRDPDRSEKREHALEEFLSELEIIHSRNNYASDSQLKELIDKSLQQLG